MSAVRQVATPVHLQSLVRPNWLVIVMFLFACGNEIVSLSYRWTIAKVVSSNFPKRSAHEPLLGKTSKSPLCLTPQTSTIPFHRPFDGISVPSAIFSLLLDGPCLERCHFTCSNMFSSIALIIAPSLNTPFIRTILPFIPCSMTPCTNGLLSSSADIPFSVPTV